MKEKELKNSEKSKNKTTSKNRSNLISNYQPLISDHNAITLIALVITIIVMLILVGVTVTVALNGGLFSQAKDAVRKTQIEEDRESLLSAVVGAISNEGTVDFAQLDKELGWTGSDGAYISPNQNSFEVDEYGNITGPIETVVDEYAGDISKGGKYDGSEEKPFQIGCIEDLVAFSIMTNGGNKDLGLESTDFLGKNIILTRTLDFKSIFSYNNYTETKYGDLNKDGTAEDIKTELTKQQDGCIGFTPIRSWCNFDGLGFAIKNIYIHSTSGDAGLFFSCKELKNLETSGTIKSDTGTAGGVMVKANGDRCSVVSCVSRAKVSGVYAGGIVGFLYVGDTTFDNCKNYGSVEASSIGGGILGFNMSGTDYIYNCGNLGDISLIPDSESSFHSFGGIIGNKRLWVWWSR